MFQAGTGFTGFRSVSGTRCLTQRGNLRPASPHLAGDHKTPPTDVTPRLFQTPQEPTSLLVCGAGGKHQHPGRGELLHWPLPLQQAPPSPQMVSDARLVLWFLWREELVG